MQTRAGNTSSNKWVTKASGGIQSGVRGISVEKQYEVFVYERFTRGFGDAVMFRPAVVANMEKYPDKRHILHMTDFTSPVLADIEGLEIVPLEGKTDRARLRFSRKISDRYKNYKLFEMSKPCAVYEQGALPNIVKSRQEIFCDVVGVEFDIENYNVRFSEECLDWADNFLKGLGQCVGVHVRSAEKWRDFRYVKVRKKKERMAGIIEGLAGQIDGTVIVRELDWVYDGNCKNVKMLSRRDIPFAWAVMAQMMFGVGPDSAGVHLFGAAEVPVYGMFGPTDPVVRLKYKNAFWSPRYKCKNQYCWYLYRRCNSGIGCLNHRTSKWYVKDIMRKMGRFLS